MTVRTVQKLTQVRAAPALMAGPMPQRLRNCHPRQPGAVINALAGHRKERGAAEDPQITLPAFKLPS